MINIIYLIILLHIFIFGSSIQQKETPTVRWGQHSHKITLMVLIESISKQDVKFTENNIHISATNKHGEDVELSLDLLRPIIPEKCSYIHLERGLKLTIQKKSQEPCWKRLTKEKKLNFLIKDKSFGDPNDCEDAKHTWLLDYMFYKRKTNPIKQDEPNKKNDPVQNIIDNLKDSQSHFSIHEF
ncbi:hypothetical protein YYC_01810 [Plasmodium yoelii 17X]|uniref:HSP20-like chaperone, putative n=3 Tax=Plasmodium yoelii TaxID=5861 RepID=A0A077YFW3_PLAYE|nr:HSP20-like chaperone, putative [Plasmodium yoelii]ETB62080.1 hypothetical protein YYC_01810 [Plasmodium yoelii 17X]CDU21008.1 conserved Plasmodium protein, unknown function [Plasmodium yoelii]VTZ81974.1 HSP20-like chaperone, putative [Plasmodium yoelii]|eukprot:XP_022813076.1 HSP20-like chaperone, putative [Plasmodium yoelii]